MAVTKKNYRNTGSQLFIPEHFEFSQTDDLLEYINVNPLANFVTQNNGQMLSSCLPLFVDADNTKAPIVVGHMARRNLQAKSLQDGETILALFTSPNAYIPSRWYQDIATAPTWNYISVQLRGKLEVVECIDDAMSIIQYCINKLEGNYSTPWDPTEIPEDRLERLRRGIIAFRIVDIEIEGICRLSQDRSENDRNNILNGLSNNTDIGSKFISESMKMVRDLY